MRLVSLCPSLTELAFDLGVGHDLVGITRWCVHPRDEVDSVEKVGGTKNPDIRRIVELDPDLVLVNEEENRAEDAQELRASGIPLHSSMPRTVEETARMVRSIGTAVGREKRAEEIAGEIERLAEEVRDRARNRPPVRWCYLIWRKPWMTVNADTYVDALLALAGGENVFGNRPTRYPEIEARELATARPDTILLSSEPFPFAEKHLEELHHATGLERERFRLVNGELLSWHGSRTPAGIRYAEEILERATGT